MKIKTAIFDMDGTLVDSLMLWEVVWSYLGKKYENNPDFRPTDQDDKTVRTITLKDAMHLIHKNYQLGNSGDELLLSVNEMLDDFYAKRVELKDGVKEFLDYLFNNGADMCIVSATSPDLIDKGLTHCGIKKYFKKVISCAEIGKGKDFPDAFLAACKFFNETPENTWVFEDSLVALETAVKTGMPTVGIYDRYNFGHDRMKEISTEYVDEGETLLKLLKQ